MSLFNKIVNKGGEDIATEIITWMLTSKNEHVPFKKLFFNRFFSQKEDYPIYQTETITQPSFENIGRPDCIILIGKSIIIIETKLGAYLSGDDQLIRYCDVFNNIPLLKDYFPLMDISEIKNYYFSMLAPQKTIDKSYKLTSELIGKDFKTWCKDREITFIPIPWEDMLSDLDLNNSIQKELYLLINDYIYQELKEDETMVLKNENVPSAISKLFKNIEDIKSHVSNKDIKTLRMSQSYNFYGFFIECKDYKSWFGYFLQIWGKYKTPIFLQIREDWIDINHRSILDKLSGYGFKYEKDHEFVKPFFVDDIDNWKDELIKIISELSGENTPN